MNVLVEVLTKREEVEWRVLSVAEDSGVAVSAAPGTLSHTRLATLPDFNEDHARQREQAAIAKLKAAALKIGALRCLLSFPACIPSLSHCYPDVRLLVCSALWVAIVTDFGSFPLFSSSPLSLPVHSCVAADHGICRKRCDARGAGAVQRD